MLSLTAVFAYGFFVTHQTVGIDDTPYTYYFEDGLNVIVGRWFMYVLNKVLHVADFAPLVTDLAGVLLLMVAVTVWATLVFSVCGDRIPKWGYMFFSCIFLSCPLLSEVYTYYLHNGISVGYLCTGLSLWFFKELVECFGETTGKCFFKKPVGNDSEARRGRKAEAWRKVIVCAFGTAFFLFVALGCYESFMIVWLVGVMLVLLLARYMGQKCRVFTALCMGALAAVVAIVLRSVMIKVCIAVFDLGAMQDEAVQRSIAEMLGWMFEPEGLANFAMAIKRTFVMYVAFGYAYYPIRIFVYATVAMVVFAVWRSIRQKDLWIAVLAAGLYVAAFLLVVIEGSATLYRAAQFLPLICGVGALVVALAAEGLKESKLDKALTKCLQRAKRGTKLQFQGIVSGIAIFCMSVILWNQCYDMNRWFYVDWLKYEDAKETMEQIAYELESKYDVAKPIIFTGFHQAPASIIEDAFVPYTSEEYYKIKRLTDLLDEDLLDKFNRGNYGVWVAQTPALSVLDWGIAAFNSSEQMVKFFAMHGYNIVPNTDTELYEKALLHSIDFPNFPKEGSVVDMGNYIIVHF